jgi:hypothetical protein
MAGVKRKLEWLIDRYVNAKEVIINEGYGPELDWQSELNFASSQESDFLREAAWVILSSGMREATIRMKFEQIANAFLGFNNAADIVINSKKCRSDAIKLFGHSGKIDAIISIAFRIMADGFERIKNLTNCYGVRYLQSFDFIGPATSFHLAKNLGLNVSKPDRHLCRVAKVSGFGSVAELCGKISEVTGDSESVVDLVIWRFATLRSDYLNWFTVK